MDNPTMQFLSAAEEQAPDENEEKEANRPPENFPLVATPPPGYKINPIYVETKKRRLQLVLKPSLYDKVKARADEYRISVNEYVHRVLEAATTEESPLTSP